MVYPQYMDIFGYIPIGSMYAIYGNIYHQFTPNVSIYTIHGSYGYGNFMAENRETSKSTEKKNMKSWS
jgi:hypothetical protein